MFSGLYWLSVFRETTMCRLCVFLLITTDGCCANMEPKDMANYKQGKCMHVAIHSRRGRSGQYTTNYKSSSVQFSFARDSLSNSLVVSRD